MVITLHDFGTFPIWHREADLHIIDLNTGESRKMDINSSETDSYHTWSSNGKWLVFSSKRTDGRTTRPFLLLRRSGIKRESLYPPAERPGILR